MQPENDTQAVRRVLARAGITAAALTLSLGAAAPAALACHGGGGHGDSGGFPAARHDRDGATQDKSKHKSSSGEASPHRDSHEDSPGGGSTHGGSPGGEHRPSRRDRPGREHRRA